MAELNLTALELLEIPDLEEYVTEVMMVTDDGEAIELKEEEREMIIEGLMKEKAATEAALVDFGGKMEGKFKDFSRRRNIKEREWVNALLQHDGREYNYVSDKKQRIFGQGQNTN